MHRMYYIIGTNSL